MTNVTNLLFFRQLNSRTFSFLALIMLILSTSTDATNNTTVASNMTTVNTTVVRITTTTTGKSPVKRIQHSCSVKCRIYLINCRVLLGRARCCSVLLDGNQNVGRVIKMAHLQSLPGIILFQFL